MATYKFTGDQTTVYVDITIDGHTLEATPGASYELEAAPDDRFIITKVATKSTDATPAE